MKIYLEQAEVQALSGLLQNNIYRLQEDLSGESQPQEVREIIEEALHRSEKLRLYFSEILRRHDRPGDF